MKHLPSTKCLYLALFSFITLTTFARADRAGDFDYYLLSMSWSPTYCADSAVKHRDQLQCYSERHYGFVVHGLWPQNDYGYPENCPTKFKGPSDNLVNQMLKFSPSKSLIHHEWNKHGICTGLSPLEYFRLAVRTYKSVKKPAELTDLTRPVLLYPNEIKNLFLKENPDMPKKGIVVTCKRQKLSEIRICFNKSGKKIACSQSTLKAQCRSKEKLRILSTR